MPLSQENRMQMAIAAYKSKKVQSKSRAAAIFGVPKSPSLIGSKESIHGQKHVLVAIY
jgi:hypothetical protein